MLGHSHAMSGLAAGAATLGFAPVHGLPEQIAWVAAWGGFAMLPDLDQGGLHWRGAMPSETGSTVARMWGPITTTLAGLVHRLARGHRNGTHDILVAPVVFGLLALLADRYTWSSLVVVAMAIGLALEALHVAIPGRVEQTVLGNLVLSFAGAFWVTGLAGHPLAWLPWAVAGGVVTHIIGDWFTVGGVPLPLTWVDGSPVRVAASLFRTGARIEHVLATGFAVTAVVLVLWHSPAGTPLATWVHPVAAAVSQLAHAGQTAATTVTNVSSTPTPSATP